MRNLTLAQVARDAVYLCVACCEDGVVRISVTRNPEGEHTRSAQRGCCAMGVGGERVPREAAGSPPSKAVGISQCAW